MADPKKVERCAECGCLLPAHYGSCSHVDTRMKQVLHALDNEAAERRERVEQCGVCRLTGGRHRLGCVNDRDRNHARNMVRDALRRVANEEGGDVRSALLHAANNMSEAACSKLHRLLK